MWSSFRYQRFVTVSGNLGGKVPVIEDFLSFQIQEIDSTTSLDEEGKDVEFQADWKNYADLKQTYLVSKLNFLKGRGYELYNTKEKK